MSRCRTITASSTVARPCRSWSPSRSASRLPSGCSSKSDTLELVHCWVIVLVAACGRINFDPVGVSGDDEPGEGRSAISAGEQASCIARDDGTVWCWGHHRNRILGQTVFVPSATPVQVSGLAEIVAVEVGNYHACAVDVAGALWCWGDNNYDQLGVPPPVADPVRVPLSRSVIAFGVAG